MLSRKPNNIKIFGSKKTKGNKQDSYKLLKSLNKDKRVANDLFLYFKDVELNSKKKMLLLTYTTMVSFSASKINYFKNQKMN
jgi:hypothetical protein